MTRKPKPCRYCREGRSVEIINGKREHWIVKSILPARIDIRACTAPTPEPVKENA